MGADMNGYGWVVFLWSILEIGIYAGMLAAGHIVYRSKINGIGLILRIVMAVVVYKAVSG